MAETFAEKINRILRDHEGYDGNGGTGALPIGDRSTAQRPIYKRDLREALGAFVDVDGNAADAIVARDEAVKAARYIANGISSRGMPRTVAKLQAYHATGDNLYLPTVRIEGDSIADGAGSSSGNAKPMNMIWGVGKTYQLLPGKVGASCSIPDMYTKAGETSYAIPVLRYGVPGATSAIALSRLAAHHYDPDPVYSQLDALVAPNGQHDDADLVIISYTNNDFINPTWERMLWFIEDSIRACLKAGQDVLIHIPHDRATGVPGSRVLDRSIIADGQNVLVALAAHYQLPVLNMRDRFRQLVDDGVQTVEDLFPVGDSVHTSDLGLEYEVAETISLFPDAGQPATMPPGAVNLPEPLYQQNGFQQNVSRWKNIFRPDAAVCGGVTLSAPFTPPTAYSSVNYPTNTRAMFGVNDGYYLLSQSGDKVSFRAAAGARVIIGSIVQAVAGEADLYINGAFVDTISKGAESIKEYAYWSDGVTGGGPGNSTTSTVELRWKSGSFGVSHICVGCPRSPGAIMSQPAGIVSTTGTWSTTGTQNVTTTQNDSIDIEFVGTGLFADLPLGPDYATYAVEVDGVSAGTLDRYFGGTVATRLVPVVRGLDYGQHVLTLTNSTKNASSIGYRMSIGKYTQVDERLGADHFSALVHSGMDIQVPEAKKTQITASTYGGGGRFETSAINRLVADT